MRFQNLTNFPQFRTIFQPKSNNFQTNIFHSLDRCTPIFSHIKNLRRRVTNTTNGDELEAREEISDNSTTPPSTSTSARQPHIGDDSMEQIPTEGPPEIDDAEMNLITSVFERNASKMRKTSGTQNWMKTRTARWIALHESPGAN